MAGRFLPPVRTPATTGDVFAALAAAAPELDRASLLVLLAQSALETGWWRSCWLHNLGNSKHLEGKTPGSWTYFTCDELLTPAHARELLAGARPRTDGRPGLDVELDPKPRADGLARVLFHPSHRGCRFRAFDSLDEGATAYLASLRTRYASAWPAVLAGDAAAFSRALKAGRYYTAPEQGYTASLLQLVAQVERQIPTPAAPAPRPPATHRDDVVVLAIDRLARESVDDDPPPEAA